MRARNSKVCPKIKWIWDLLLTFLYVHILMSSVSICIHVSTFCLSRFSLSVSIFWPCQTVGDDTLCRVLQQKPQIFSRGGWQVCGAMELEGWYWVQTWGEPVRSLGKRKPVPNWPKLVEPLQNHDFLWYTVVRIWNDYQNRKQVRTCQNMMGLHGTRMFKKLENNWRFLTPPGLGRLVSFFEMGNIFWTLGEVFSWR